MVTFPAITFGFILATLYGASFHLVAGGDARRLALYLVTAWLAFAGGQVMGTVLAIQILKIGTLQLFTASITTLLALILVSLVARRRRLFA